MSCCSYWIGEGFKKQLAFHHLLENIDQTSAIVNIKTKTKKQATNFSDEICRQ